MSRNEQGVDQNVTITHGRDHAVGEFLQVQDRRYQESGEDDQGEGYVLDWDSMFGFSTNLIGCTIEDIKQGEARLNWSCVTRQKQNDGEYDTPHRECTD